MDNNAKDNTQPKDDKSDKFKDTIVTTAGRQLLLTVGAGFGEILYTRVALFGQSVTSMDDETIRGLTTLDDQKMEVVPTVTPPMNNSVTVSVSFSNKDLTSDLTYNSIGWFAQNNDDKKEVLLGITPALGERTIPAGSPDHRSTASLDISLAFAVSNAAKVDLTVNEIGVAHMSDVNAAILKLKAEYDPKIAEAGKVKGAKINDGAVVEPDDDGILDLIVDSDRIKDLPAGLTDLNNLTESGMYRLDTLQNSVANRPPISPLFLQKGFLKVISDAKTKNVVQFFVTPMGSNFVWLSGRRGDGSAWSNWNRASSTSYSNDDIKNLINSKVDGLNVGQFIKKVNGITPDGSGNVNVTSTVARGFDANANVATKETVENLHDRNQILLDQNAGQDIVNWAKGQFNTLNGNINKLNAKTEIPGVANANDLVGDASSISTYKLSNSGNLNVPDFYPDKRGTLININYDGNAKTQIWIPVGNSGGDSIALRYWEGNNYPKWKKLATVQDTTNLQNQINDLKKSNADLIGTVNWLKDNAAIARRFPASQEAQAQQWENDHPNYFALIEKIDRKKVKAC
ncbi:pyocin knob domain-containing protein [Lactobacillus crispatus]|uniref:pyocin knob domain-containing protein n=1 Tax=Lactobacillus crispatus TaxID=47770 RepID=UPI001E4DC1D6|nr:pyocin knob domain-containing protein [Lactobacillus crispatus]